MPNAGRILDGMPTTLDRAPLGVALAVVTASGPDAVVRRLGELGLRRGARVTCVQRTAGGGRVVDVAGSRIALGRTLLSSIDVEQLTSEPA